MKRHSTDARIISAFLHDTWLRDQQHATLAQLIRNRRITLTIAAATMTAPRVQIISAIADGKAESGTPSTPRNARRYAPKFANSVLVL
jgi:hypothetical protein